MNMWTCTPPHPPTPAVPPLPALSAAKCRPGCKSALPYHDCNKTSHLGCNETHDPGYTWWDQYNVTTFFHSLGYDVYLLSMPLKGINLFGTPATNSTSHWWFEQWERKGDSPLRYFLEPIFLTVNHAKALGYQDIHMAGHGEGQKGGARETTRVLGLSV